MAFTLQQSKESSFFGGTIYSFVHTKTDCEVIHIHNEDPENIFMFAVPSYVHDNTGVAHILEHSVLSGSERYRVKTPFFRLLQGSCSTYLNASTYPDRTLYPGASLLKEDLFNIMAMSGDAVWYPLLREEVFRQEGFHFIFGEKGTHKTAGVVFNEMKGVYSDKYTLLENKIHSLLFPDTAYRFDSGGNPFHIIDLTYDDFLAYHKKYYRPEHTKIMLYGNIPTRKYLDFLDKQLLSRWHEKKQSLPLEKTQEHIDLYEKKDGNEKIHFVTVPSSEYAGGEEGNVDISWLIGETKDIELNSMLHVMHFVLLGIPGAPLRMALMKTGLFEDISPLSGSSGYLSQSIYTIGATGIKTNDYNIFIDVVMKTLQTIVRDGISEEIKNAAMSRIAFSYKERLNSTNGKINFLSSLAAKCLYKEDVFSYMDIPSIIDRIRTTLSTPRALEHFIEKYLIHNTHRVIVGASPNTAYEQSYMQEEAMHLQKKIRHNEDTHYWKSVQEKVERWHTVEDQAKDIQAIPLIHKTSLPKTIDTIEYEDISLGGNSHGVWIPHIENGVIYCTMYFDCTDLIMDDETRLLLPTFAATLTDIGVKNISYDEFSIQICLHTGKMSAELSNITHTDGSIRIGLSIKISVLEESLGDAFALIQRMLLETDFENTVRLYEILSEGKSMLRNRMLEAGTTLAIMRAAANYNFNVHIDDDWNGVAQLEWLLANTDIASMGKKLYEISLHIFCKDRVSFTIVGAPSKKTKTLPHIENLIDALPHQATAKTIGTDNIKRDIQYETDKFGKKLYDVSTQPFLEFQALIIPTKVAYNAMVFPSVSYTDKNFSVHKLFAKIVSEKLLKEIRMEYGAYGASATMLGDEKLFVCYTYRDPNIRESFAVFKKVIQDISDGHFESEALDSHIVGAVGESLVSMSPSAKRMLLHTRLLSKITDETRQNIRDGLLQATKEHVCKAALLYNEMIMSKDYTISKASVCSEEMSKALHWDSVSYAPH